MTWWRSLYDDLVADVLLVRRDPSEVEDTVRFLERRLELSPGARVFDQCCGIGSLAAPLAARGYCVIGVDQATGYIERARRADPDIELHVGDADRFVCAPPADAAFNWATSFGYAATDEENLAMLERAFESLAPGGRFALDVLALPGVLRHFQPRMENRRSTATGDVVLVRDTTIDVVRGAMLKRWAFTLPDGREITRESSVRLYLPHTIGELLSEAGFAVEGMLGAIDGRPLDIDSLRCIAIARRPR